MKNGQKKQLSEIWTTVLKLTEIQTNGYELPKFKNICVPCQDLSILVSFQAAGNNAIRNISA